MPSLPPVPVPPAPPSGDASLPELQATKSTATNNRQLRIVTLRHEQRPE
jgi:hypothetical protein